MTSKLLVACLVTLKAEIDEIFPDRPRESDGDIGDQAHQDRVSDHNDDEVGRVPIHDADSKHEVHALDITRFEYLLAIVMFVVARCRSGAERRLRYIIFNRKIWEASNGWRPREWDGADDHTGHAHFSASYDSIHEADTRPWHLEEIAVALTPDDKKWISELFAGLRGDVAELPAETGSAVHNTIVGRSGVTIGQHLAEIRGDVNKLVATVVPDAPVIKTV